MQIGNAENLKALVESAEGIIIPFIVIAELKAGFEKGNLTESNNSKLALFLEMDRVEVAWPDIGTVELYAKIWSDLSSKGKPIPTNDIWIAALCVQHNLRLATDDSDFDHVALLQLVPIRDP